MITQINYDSVRNLSHTSISVNSDVCIICGANGAGKTSVLESLHILGTGRSFRTHQISQVIEHNAQQLQVFAKLATGDTIGVQRNRDNDFVVRINKENQQRLSVLAEYLPVRTMTPESFLLLTAGAQNRRQFLDFSVFHVEHSFAKLWQTYSRLLKQRNALLKQSADYKSFVHWDNQTIPVIKQINHLRLATFEQLKGYFSYYQNRFLPQYDVQYHLSTGVPDGDLTDLFKKAFESDRRYGFTSLGPHKADIKIRLDRTDAHQIFSRGELKMMVACLIMGQVKWLIDKGTSGYLLLDDLVSELDSTKQELIFNEVKQLKGLQTFITSINLPDYFTTQKTDSYQMFHVEHGVISESKETN